MANNRELSQTITRALLGSVMTYAGITHLSTRRKDFQAQVPPWLPVKADHVVLGSGVAEIGLGSGLLLAGSRKRLAGLALAAFYFLIFPGNIAQYVERRDAFGLDTDRKRFVRLLFQAPLIAAALWAGGIPSRTATPAAEK